jgi:hypothetical protein
MSGCNNLIRHRGTNESFGGKRAWLMVMGPIGRNKTELSKNIFVFKFTVDLNGSQIFSLLPQVLTWFSQAKERHRQSHRPKNILPSNGLWVGQYREAAHNIFYRL